MRQAFIIGALVLFGIINILGSMSEMQAPFSQTDDNFIGADGEPMTEAQILEQLNKPEIVDTSWIASATTVITKIGDYLLYFGKFISLYHPALWQGDMLFLYLTIILPIGISFWVVLLLSIRGVGSG